MITKQRTIDALEKIARVKTRNKMRGKYSTINMYRVLLRRMVVFLSFRYL